MGKERGRVSNGGGRAGSGRGTLMSTGMLVWISCGSHPHASNWWVPRVITQIANPRVFHFTVKQSHVALKLFTRSSVSHHSHSLEQRRTQANSHQTCRTGAIGPFSTEAQAAPGAESCGAARLRTDSEQALTHCPGLYGAHIL